MTTRHIDRLGLVDIAIIAGSALLMLASDALTWVDDRLADFGGDE